MLDLPGSIEAARPIIDGWNVIAPTPPQHPHWRTIVHLRGEENVVGDASLTPFVVGAYGHSRQDSMVRGFGEGIERAALVPRAGIAEPGPDVPRLDVTDPWLALAGPGALDAAGTCMPAWSLADSSPRAVPSALVDYPIALDDVGGAFDPSPSGAASGIGHAAALRSALLEVIERDAFLVAWDVGAGVPRIDLEQLPAPVSSRSRGARAVLTRLVRFIKSIDATLVLADLPTDADGILCTAAVLVDSHGDGRPRTSVGCNAHDDPWVSVLGAVQESLQLRSLLMDQKGPAEPVGPAAITDEQARLDRLATREGADDVLAWVDGFTAPRDRTYADVTTPELVESLVAAGADPLGVDLSPRLPAELRAHGWSAVKVIPVGMQPFRLDERYGWSWNSGRRHRVVERLSGHGIRVLRPHGGGPPHPLP